MDLLSIFYATLTTLTILGGVPRPPRFWMRLCTYSIVQTVAVWIVVAQSMKFQTHNLLWSLLFAVSAVCTLNFIHYLENVWGDYSKKYQNATAYASCSSRLPHITRSIPLPKNIDPPTRQPKRPLLGTGYYNPKFFEGGTFERITDHQ